MTPPLALIRLTRTFAAASAGPSNGAMFPLLSNAQPITIGACAFVCRSADAGSDRGDREPEYRQQRPEGAPSLPCCHSCLPLDSR